MPLLKPVRIVNELTYLTVVTLMSELEFHPHIRTLLRAASENSPPPITSLTVEEIRIGRNQILAGLAGPPRPVAGIEDIRIPAKGGEITIRVYYPVREGCLPGLLYFHGGGWFVGNLDTHDSLCRKLSLETGCVVVSVDYRLAPEYKFPTAVEDAYAAAEWVAENATRINCSPERLAVAGDSAGGNLAAVVCLMARDRGGPEFRFQLLVYPNTDLSDFGKNSFRKYGDRLILTTEIMTFYRNAYLDREEDSRNSYASPLLAPDLRGLPPALIITAEHDILACDGADYARRLEEAGVPATHSVYKGMIHLFFGMADLGPKENGMDEAVTALRQALFA